MIQTVKNFARGFALTAALTGAAASQEPKPATPEAPAKTSVKADSMAERLKSAISTLLGGVTPKPAQEPKPAAEKKIETKKPEPKPEVKEESVKSDFKKNLSSPTDFDAASADIRLGLNNVLAGFQGFRKTLGLMSEAERTQKWAAMSEVLAPTVAYYTLYQMHIKGELELYRQPKDVSLSPDEASFRENFASTVMPQIDKDMQELLKEFRFSALNKGAISAYLVHYVTGSPEMEQKRLDVQTQLGINPTTGNSGEAEYFAKAIAQAEEDFARQQAAAATVSGQTVIAKPKDTETSSTAKNIVFLTQAVALGATVWGAYKLISR